MRVKHIISIFFLIFNSYNLMAAQHKSYDRIDEHQININTLDVDVTTQDFERLDEHQIIMQSQMYDEEDENEIIDESTINSQYLDEDMPEEYERLDEFEINEDLALTS